MKKKICIVYGTRPEFIKLAPLILNLRENDRVELTTISTGQHKEMLDSLEDLFGIQPDVLLDVMVDNQTINSVVSKVIQKLEKFFNENQPDVVVVQGDTATVFATAICCYFRKIKVAHVEAGLRSFNLEHPFPEEFNRKVVSVFAEYNFAPTQESADNLLKENTPKEKVYITGNTVIDALNLLMHKLEGQTYKKKTILVTAHRRENHGDGIRAICESIIELSKKRDDIQFIWPVHPNPNVGPIVRDMLGDIEAVNICEPLNYLTLLSVMKGVDLIWTDSGGIQEEGPSFKKPILILREVTERPEVIHSGFGILVGTNQELLVSKTQDILDSEELYESMIQNANPFGDGTASKQIENILESYA